jgi:hypothetical protein
LFFRNKYGRVIWWFFSFWNICALLSLEFPSQKGAISSNRLLAWFTHVTVLLSIRLFVFGLIRPCADRYVGVSWFCLFDARVSVLFTGLRPPLLFDRRRWFLLSAATPQTLSYRDRDKNATLDVCMIKFDFAPPSDPRSFLILLLSLYRLSIWCCF